MKNKFLISTLILFFVLTVCSQIFATNNMMDSARDAVNNAEGAIENSANKTKDTVVNGTQNLVNDAGTLGNDAVNGMNNMTNDTATTLDMDANDDYTAQRTATANTGLFGMSNTLSTWVILGIVGAVIVALVWYYGSQYEHKNYNND